MSLCSVLQVMPGGALAIAVFKVVSSQSLEVIKQKMDNHAVRSPLSKLQLCHVLAV